jgi:hypothetical protein
MRSEVKSRHPPDDRAGAFCRGPWGFSNVTCDVPISENSEPNVCKSVLAQRRAPYSPTSYGNSLRVLCNPVL